VIVKSELAKSFMKEMVLVLAQNESIDELQYVGKIMMNRFPSESDYVNYYIGNYYYKKEKFDKSLNYFGRIQSSGNVFRNEIVYKMGIINELAMKNSKMAAYYFAMLLDVKEYDEYVAAARIELSIIYFERGMKDQSKKILDDIMHRKENIAAIIRAGNLYSQFGFDKAEAKK
jgi:tetratricopeptide (TPR) repeat protein